MAKGLPYFKFTPTEWLTGDITFESFEVQGLFINICALYWQRDGILTLEDIEFRYRKPTALPSLIDRYISVTDGLIKISFLDEQLEERNHISTKNSENGKLGGRPKTLEEKPTANRPLSDRKANKSQQEEEERKKNKNKNKIEERKLKFAHSLEIYLELYGRDLLNDFYRYWSEPNKSNTKFKQELEKTWDLKGRLETWARRDKNFNKPQPPQDRQYKEFK